MKIDIIGIVLPVVSSFYSYQN